MNIKDILKNLKENLLSPTNLDYEFDAELEDHQIGSGNIYRLHYINYHRIGGNYYTYTNNIGIIDWPFKPFTLPYEMNREDAFKILSYLTDYIETELNLEPCSHKSVSTLDEVINLEKLMFKRPNMPVNTNDIIELFTVTGRLQLFKKNEYYPKYFEWYKEQINLEEVKNIYSKYGIEFYDLEEINHFISQPQLTKQK